MFASFSLTYLHHTFFAIVDNIIHFLLLIILTLTLFSTSFFSLKDLGIHYYAKVKNGRVQEQGTTKEKYEIK